MLKRCLLMYQYNKQIGQKKVKFFNSKLNKLKETDIVELIYLCKPEWKLFIFAGICHGVSSGILMLLPKVIPEFGKLYDQKKEKINDADPLKDEKIKKNSDINKKYFDFLKYWGTLCFLSGLFTFGRRYTNGDLGNRIAFRMRNKIYQNLLSRDNEFFQRKNISSANFVHKLSNDVTQIGNSLSFDLFICFRGIIFILGGSTYIVWKCPELIFPALIIMSGLTMSSKVIGGYQRFYKIEETKNLTKTSEIASERLSNMKLIKISNTEEQEKFTYLRALNDFYKSSQQVNHYTALNYGILEGFGFLSLISILTYGSYLVTINVANPDLLSSSIYAFYVGMGFRSLFNSYTELKKTAGLQYGIDQLVGSFKNCSIYNDPNIIKLSHNLLEEYLKNVINQSHESSALLTDVNAVSITLKNLTFKYSEYGEDRNLFLKLNLKIEKGKIIAIVGSSGSGKLNQINIYKGKTSLLNLITRLYKPDEGQVLIDDQDINSNLDSQWVQKNISYVTQEPILFMGTIYQNLIYGNQGFDLSLQNVIEASKIANSHNFIMDMPDQYQTLISERGGSLSGGQKQRLILARALIKNPKILIMDEGTANLDQETEKNIIVDLKKICKNRTCIIVAHKIENYMDLIDELIDLDKLKLNQIQNKN